MNNKMKKRYEEDCKFDKQIARSELKSFIADLNELGIKPCYCEENTERLYIKIDLKNISKEQKTSLRELMKSLNANFTIKEEENYIICYDKPISNSY